MKLSSSILTLISLVSFSSAASDSASTAAATESLSTYSVVISRYGAFFTRVMTMTGDDTAAWVAQYTTDSNILAYTIGDAAGSMSFYSRLAAEASTAESNTADSNDNPNDSSATTTSESKDSTTAASSESSELSADSSSSSTGGVDSVKVGLTALGCAAMAALLL